MKVIALLGVIVFILDVVVLLLFDWLYTTSINKNAIGTALGVLWVFYLIGSGVLLGFLINEILKKKGGQQ